MDIRHHPSPPPPILDREKLGQIVLVLQGGGALGAYQIGVYQALSEAGIEPDWVIGTSIGAINAGIIAGNKPENRLAKIEEFWTSVRHGPLAQWASSMPFWGSNVANSLTVTNGIPGFFTPNPLAALGDAWPMDPEAAGYYSTAPLARTLERVIDKDILASCSPRLTVGAANVRTGEMHYFDSNKQPLTIDHIMASGALPPAFPAVRIDGDLYWDGGILSNTPVEAVFDDNPRRSGLVFVVHIWQPHGPEPDSLRAVMSRQKDVQYASRATAHIDRQRQLHRLRHVVTELASMLPESAKDDPRVREMRAYGCVTRMHVVQLTAPSLPGEDHTKDIDFSRAGVKARSDAGYAHATSILAQRPWEGDFDPREGLILHSSAAGTLKDN